MCHSNYFINFKIGPVSKRHAPKPHPKRAILMLVLTDEQQTILHAQATDARGNPASLDPNNPPTRNVSDPNLLTITPFADNMSATVVAVGPLGTAQASITATIGGNQVVGTLDVQIVASDAVNISVSADTPTNITPPAPTPTPTPTPPAP